MSGEKCNTWKDLAIKFGVALIGLVSFVAITFASVTWGRGENREERLQEVEKKQVGFDKDIQHIKEGVDRLEVRFETAPKATAKK